MAISTNDIIQRALTILDERLIEVDQLASTEMSLQDIAAEVLPAVALKVVKELPFELKRLMAPTNYAQTGFSVAGYPGATKKKVVLNITDSFWELVSIKFPSWDKIVTSYITIDSPEYAIQNNPFTRAGSQNPVVVLSDRSSSRTLECYSVEEGDSVTTEIFRYITTAQIPGTASFTSLPDVLLEPFAKALAAELIMIKDNAGKSALLENETQKSINQHE